MEITEDNRPNTTYVITHLYSALGTHKIRVTVNNDVSTLTGSVTVSVEEAITGQKVGAGICTRMKWAIEVDY